MSLCRKCGGKLPGEVCHRHGSQQRVPPKMQTAETPPAAAHAPYSPETDRRVWAMIGRVCQGCTASCGDMAACPIQRAKWFGDWSGENQQPGQLAAAEHVLTLPPVVKPTIIETQLSLF